MAVGDRQRHLALSIACVNLLRITHQLVPPSDEYVYQEKLEAGDLAARDLAVGRGEPGVVADVETTVPNEIEEGG